MAKNKMWHTAVPAHSRNYTEIEMSEYSLVNPIPSAEAATLSPPVFKQTPTLHTKNPPKGPPRQQNVLYLVFN